MVMGKPNTVKDFWKNVDILSSDNCWNWIGFVAKQGYGRTSFIDINERWAHRIAYTLTYGNIKGYIIKHKCNNKLCCNPDHMLCIVNNFWKNVIILSENKCWNWIGIINNAGYGIYSGKLAHRVSWKLENQTNIPDGLNILHKCDNKSCVNPKHLYVGTQKQNMSDMISRGRKNPALGENNGNSSITTNDVLEIRRLYKLGFSITEISNKLSIGKTATRLVVTNKTWKHVKA